MDNMKSWSDGEISHEDDRDPRWSSYLSLVPRGLQSIISDIVRDKLDGYEYRIEQLTPRGTRDDSTIVQQATNQILNAQEKKRSRQAKKEAKLKESGQGGGPSTSFIDTSSYCSRPVGSAIVNLVDQLHSFPCKVDVIEDEFRERPPPPQLHITMGYCDNKDEQIWSCAGNMSGCVWYKLVTTAPASVVGNNLRCFGPLLALVSTNATSSSTVSSSSQESSTSSNIRVLPWNTLKESNEDLKEFIEKQIDPTYEAAFDQSLRVWHEHTKCCWRELYENEEKYQSLQDRINDNKLSFRLSSIRDSSYISKQQKYNYSRQELLEKAFDFGILPSKYDDSWNVDLTKFDIEVVLLIYDSMVAIGLSLRPYKLVGAKSFSSGALPPDISRPYIGGDALSGLVRLRPSTAHILLNFANLQPGDVVLDPCAGIGTIPLEAELFSGKRSCVGLGGDLVLNHPTIAHAACSLLSAATTTSAALDGSATGVNFVSSLATWDAAHLPIRTASIDVVVSDLPFGKQCLSASALTTLLPLVVSELARVLLPTSSTPTPSSSRMVLLCGSFESLLQAIHHTSQYWRYPCKAIIPVTIGGLNAWIIHIERNDIPFSEGVSNRLERVKKLTSKRERIAHFQEMDPTNHSSKKSRIQS